MSRLLISLLLAASVVLPASAQQAPPPGAESSPDAIVVQGIRDQKKEIGKFVDALTPAPVLGQLSRFDWAVCPAAVGLGEAHNQAIAKRMRAVAKAAAMPVAGDDCRPNALLIVAPDKAELIDQLRSKYPAYFERVSEHDIKQLKRGPSPAAAWQVKGLLDADGVEVPYDSVNDYYVVERTDISSRLKTTTRPHFIASIVVVELSAINGLTATQLADYAAMRAFAATDPARVKSKEAQTILAALEAPMNSPVPLTLTEWDLAFLKGLYASDPERTATSQRNEMKQIVRRTLQDGRKGEE